MTLAPQSRGFSIVRTLGRYTCFHRGMQFGEAYEPRPIAAALPGDDLDVLRAQLAPVMASLDRDRAAHADRADHFLLKRVLPAAALVGLVLGWGISGDILLGLFLAALFAASALILLFGRAMDEPRRVTRHEIVDALARHLMGFQVDPSPVIGTEELDELKLFSHIRKVTVDLCLTGQRDGRIIVVSRIGLMFGRERRYKEKQGGGLTFVMVEVALPETAESGTTTTIMAKDASIISKVAQKLMHRDRSQPTGDRDFDECYAVSGDISRVTPGLRAGFARLEAEARCGPTGLTEVPAGSGLRPWVVILPVKLVVLTPLSMFDGAFEPPPYWEKLDPDVLIPAFASDLAILNGYLNAALSFPLGDIT
ncbi:MULTISPECIES: hypothetical protein [unclassified Yoonia]|uniref:hypothetical protein n=1 Tax=unclassified Yoonia TaxID=2629118 RepID=UPI002AFEAAFA|nr:MULTISPECIES: hypothetical protein [unclassified Yoonia]